MASAVAYQTILCNSSCWMVFLLFMGGRIAYHQANGKLDASFKAIKKTYSYYRRRWRLLVVEALFAGIVFLAAVFIAKPVFLTPLQAEPQPPLTSVDIYASLRSDTLLGYAPNTQPFVDIMERAAFLLNTG
ncbi:hypothetical protein O3G_MSEX000626 [Manduca sexta]|nr:hypothetical protein O3G_MSEX000626 [Manduca sexta]